MHYRDYFKGKRITVMGLGLLGRGVGDAVFLAECGAELIVTDLKSEEELASSLESLAPYKDHIAFHLGGHRLEDFQDRDLILKAAGVPLDSPYIAEVKKHNTPVRMSADLLVEFAHTLSIGVTGTRGKSTVTHLIAHTLGRAGKKVLLGGNIRGVSSLSLLSEVTPDSILVLELDSWQLQGFKEARLSPNIAVFTNLQQDHLNYYPNEAAYFADKANIFAFQKEGDTLIAGKAVVEKWLTHALAPIPPMVPEDVPEEWNLKIVGEHNRENAALAREALRAAGLSEEEIKDGIESFEGVEGRLQYLGRGIYNDNNATTPDATIAALRALSREKPIILIVGGADKKLPLDALAQEINTAVQKVILLEGENTTGSEKLEPLLKIPYEKVGTVSEALHLAVREGSGFTILFSPAFASFGMFTNEYDRGDQFVRAVEALKKENPTA